jgi:hypothetical protein
MAVKDGKEKRRWHVGRRRRRRDTARLSEMLAPPEERQPEAKPRGDHNHNGAIIVDSTNLRVPTDFVDADDGKRILGLEPVVLVILLAAVAFIIFIAYLISLEPPAP